MQKQVVEFSSRARISTSEVYEQFTKNYQYLITEFYEYQTSWFYRAYSVFNDFDKYLILSYFFKKNFFNYSEMFILKTFEEYYSIEFIELEKFNTIEISKELRISKETARRKILELEKDGIIIKNNKRITLNLKSVDVQRNLRTIQSFSRILSSISKILCANKVVRKEYNKEFFEKKIKEKFTQIWGIFLEYQIEYILARKIIMNNDIEIFFILGVLIYNQNLSLKKNSHQIYYGEEWLRDITNIDDKRGLNAMTISELTGIPRPTVIRKLKILLKQKDAVKDRKNLYSFIRGPGFIKLNKIRLQNVSNLSSAIARINNIIFYS